MFFLDLFNDKRGAPQEPVGSKTAADKFEVRANDKPYRAATIMGSLLGTLSLYGCSFLPGARKHSYPTDPVETGSTENRPTPASTGQKMPEPIGQGARHGHSIPSMANFLQEFDFQSHDSDVFPLTFLTAWSPYTFSPIMWRDRQIFRLDNLPPMHNGSPDSHNDNPVPTPWLDGGSPVASETPPQVGQDDPVPGENVAPAADDEEDDSGQKGGNPDTSGRTNTAPMVSSGLFLGLLYLNQPVLLSLADFLAGTVDAEGDDLQILDLTVSSGELVFMGEGSWKYIADDAEVQSVEFTFKISDGEFSVAQHADALVAEEPREIFGTLGDDFLIGTPFGDIIYGLAGDDLIYGREGDDVIHGGAGDDRLVGGDGNDTIYGGDGNDTLIGGQGNDVLFGESGNDSLFGDDGQDVMSGGTGDDYMDGGAGDDVMSGDGGQDRMFGGQGNDIMSGGDGRDAMSGGQGADVMDAGAGDDTVAGDDGDDFIDGGDGDDTVDGGAGNDTILLGQGNDSGAGGSGNDTFLVQQAGPENTTPESGPVDDGDDNYDGGEGTDTIDMSDLHQSVFVDFDKGTIDSAEAGHDTFENIEHIIGGHGDDCFTASSGEAVMTGGEGDDQYIFDVKDDAPLSVRVTDFAVGDYVRLAEAEIREHGDAEDDAFTTVYALDADGDISLSDFLRFEVRYEDDESGQYTRIRLQDDHHTEIEYVVSLDGHHSLDVHIIPEGH